MAKRKKKRKFVCFYGRRNKKVFTEINERGNEVSKWFHPSDRYYYDQTLCNEKQGWKQWDTDQDAAYFGVWVHPDKRHILTYCEGDVFLVKCPDQESFRDELKTMSDFYGEPPPAFTFLNVDEGTLTELIEERYMG